MRSSTQKRPLEHKEKEIWIRVGGELASLDELARFVQRDHCGAVNLFQGVTRNHDGGEKITGLFYDAYVSMALNELLKLAIEIRKEFELGAVAVHHKTGEVPVGEASMNVALSSPHRKASLDATAKIIRRIKEVVPIWKKEFFEGDTPDLWKEEKKLN